jgi:putative protease
LAIQSRPELLAPAGSLEKLKVAFSYGADAVYLGGLKYGLRSAADNFTKEELIEAMGLAKRQSKRVYVVLNSFFFDEDFQGLREFVQFLESLGVDALIVSDLGVISEVRSFSQLPIHLSTQASCLNASAAQFWKSQGVHRLILGREVSLDEAQAIKKASGLEVELFIHGSMCMAYSGNCTISNYTSGRDSNRGGCAHSCRFEYTLKDQENEEATTSYFMSSKDLNGLDLLPQYFEKGIDSIKVEGRMKSHLYVGTISKVYSEALVYYEKKGHFPAEKLERWQSELRKFTHRDYTTASLLNKAGEESIFDERDHKENNYVVVGDVTEVVEDSHILLNVKHKFKAHDEIEFLPFEGETLVKSYTELRQLNGQVTETAQPNMLLKLPFLKGCAPYNIVRRRV